MRVSWSWNESLKTIVTLIFDCPAQFCSVVNGARRLAILPAGFAFGVTVVMHATSKDCSNTQLLSGRLKVTELELSRICSDPLKHTGEGINQE
jgi:hypothetical protein